MTSDRTRFTLRIALSAATAILILAGATLNVSGRSGQAALITAVAGLLALLAGVLNRMWKAAVPLGLGAIVLTFFAPPFRPWDLGGLLLLGLGGLAGSLAYRSFTDAMRRQLDDVIRLNAQLQEKHRAFMAATSDADSTSPPGDVAALTSNIAQQIGSGFACYFLASPDGKQFVPQPPGIGLERLHPQAVNRVPGAAGPLMAAIEAGKEFVSRDETGLMELAHYLPDDLRIDSLMAVPMPIGEHIGGFVLLGNKPGGFTDDDRRLARTLTLRAGAQLASAHAVALSRKESARYSLMNELVKEASGKSMNEVLELVLEKGKQVIRYEAGSIALFQPDNTYIVLGGSGGSQPIAGPLAKVRDGETVLRSLVTVDEGIYSGLIPSSEGGTVNEALTPIRGKDGVFGAICLGRNGTMGFNQRDIAALDELGSMAGVAVESSRILEGVTGQASKKDMALDALGEVSQALTTVTQGSEVLKQKTLETAVLVTTASAGLLTRTQPDGSQKTIKSLNLPSTVDDLVVQNGQGIIGATMLSERPVTVPDLSQSPELQSPPNLVQFGLHAAICMPMLEDGLLWGTLSVFDVKKREWTADDLRVLDTLGNQGVVAVRNADLYEKSQRDVWELRNLQDALQAATSTNDLNQVLVDVLKSAANAASAKIGCLALDDSGRLVLKSAYGTESTTAEKLALIDNGDICREVMESKEPFMEAMEQDTVNESPLNPRAVLCVPITLHGKSTGVLFLANYQLGHVFTRDHKHVVNELAAQAGVTIENARLFKENQEGFLSALKALAIAEDERDPYTAGHSQRVTQYALMIARQMKYASKDQEAWVRLERGGMLHDIGKIVVPDAILTKAGKLTDEEFAKMKEHPVAGFNILSGLKMLTDELVIVRSHHERYDGKGYPDRKKGDEVPMFAWIVSAADAIDAMTSDRPYRKACPLELAVEQVRAGAGTHFHPDVAEAVLDAAHNGALKVIRQENLYKDAPTIGAFENPTS
jgi:HD-GYP domain-containing protein (c-di-GMP phosphodiesterase class II)